MGNRRNVREALGKLSGILGKSREALGSPAEPQGALGTLGELWEALGSYGELCETLMSSGELCGAIELLGAPRSSVELGKVFGALESSWQLWELWEAPGSSEALMGARDSSGER